MKRGEIWSVNLDPTIGTEIKKIRPCVIVSRDALARLPLRIIVPLTGWKVVFEQAAWHVLIEPTGRNGLSKRSSADTFQVRSISGGRFLKKIGECTTDEMAKIDSGLALSLSLD